MTAKTYTVGADTEASVERLREMLAQRWTVQLTYSQVIRYATLAAIAELEKKATKEEGRDD